MIHTPLCDLLGTEFPIIQGAMAHVSTGAFAAAVSGAGGLGVIASSSKDEAYTREQIKAVRARTRYPFGVNITLSNPSEAIVDVILEEGVSIVFTGAGNPAPYMKDLLSNGCKVIPVVPHVRAAKKMEALGATAIVAEGGESGGHVGMVNTMTLVPMVTAAVKIPVIAAGGIADGRGFIAALAMGAIGIQMGTAFLTTKECPIHPSYKERLIAAAETDTVVTGLGTKEPVRCVRNPLTDNYFAMLKQNLPQEELMKPLKGSLYRAVNGDLTTGSIQAGQITGMLQEIKTVRQVMEDVMNSAEQVLQRLRVCPKSLASKIRW